MNDPLGLSAGQRRQSEMNEITERFVAQWGDRIELAADGAWFVRHEGQIIRLPLPSWPLERFERAAGD
jgi:hypothetical protein